MNSKNINTQSIEQARNLRDHILQAKVENMARARELHAYALEAIENVKALNDYIDKNWAIYSGKGASLDDVQAIQKAVEFMCSW